MKLWECNKIWGSSEWGVWGVWVWGVWGVWGERFIHHPPTPPTPPTPLDFSQEVYSPLPTPNSPN
ncbi:hypothetical protein BCD64_24315 [Nostoc sp. MBR 210]|nr:hypothetical protein BCD64_24315 [Nostoc sp. MBR 210]